MPISKNLLTKRIKEFDRFFNFYYKVVKPLYSSISADNSMPQEVLFEINAAFDHLSRIWGYDEYPKKSLDDAHRHLKRSCLDIFKLKVKSTTDKYNELLKIDLTNIDNGNFVIELRALYHEIKIGAIKARKDENQYSHEFDSAAAYDYWYPVYTKCIDFENRFYLNKNISWAKRRSTFYSQKYFWVSVLASYLASALILPKDLLSFLLSLLNILKTKILGLF